MAKIDDALIERLILTQLLTLDLAVWTVLGRSERERSGDTRVARLVRVELTPMPQRIGVAEVDNADVVVGVSVRLSQTVARNGGVYALKRALAQVAAVLREVRLEDAGTTHNVTLHKPVVSEDAAADENRQITSGSVIVTGIAQRTTGTTLE